MELKIIKLDESAIAPRYAHPGDAGLDLFAIREQTILPGKTQLIQTGIAIALPPGTEAQIRPRSGLALKHSITVLNSPGTIDAGYRGELGVILINHGQQSFLITPRMRIAQLVLAPIIRAKVTVVTELDHSLRGEDGFGSTGITEL